MLENNNNFLNPLKNDVFAFGLIILFMIDNGLYNKYKKEVLNFLENWDKIRN
jgi:hypothetical protein